MKNLLKIALNWAKLNKNNLAIGGGIGGGIVAGVLIAKETPKYLQLRDEAAKEKGSDLTRTEKLKIGVKAYGPSIVIGGLSIASIIAGAAGHTKLETALGGALVAKTKELDKFKDVVKDELGEAKTQKLVDKKDVEMAKDNPPPEDEALIPVVGRAYGKLMLWRDPITGAYFRGNIDEVNRLVTEAAAEFNGCDVFTYNDLYGWLGLEDTTVGGILQWDRYSEAFMSTRMVLKLDDTLSDTAPNGEPYKIFRMLPEPKFPIDFCGGLY